MPVKIVAGNWKMNTSLEEAKALASEIVSKINPTETEVVICPPFPYLEPIRQLISGTSIRLGAQNCAAQKNGAFTGEVSASMLASLGVQYVILGHSERRSLFGENDEVIASKLSLALENGLKVIFCCGETLQERESGLLEEVLKRQIRFGIPLGHSGLASRLVVAYEPVWAIGTGQTASPDQAEQAHEFIRTLLVEQFPEEGADISILYGGSCNPSNAAELFARKNIDGGLIGGASLKAADFMQIVQAFK